MRNLVLTLLALLAVPAFAAPVITATESGGVVTIGYDANGADLVSGMGLVVTLSDGTVKTGTFTDLSTDYWVHPSNIIIDTGAVTDEGSPIAAGGEGQNTITVEYGALYDGEANAPAAIGDLFSFEIEGATGDVTVDVAATHAGGVVTEALEAFAPTAQVVVAGGPAECFPAGHPDYSEWVAVGKPDSWCYPRQCYGDADGQSETVGWFTYFVANNDLQILINQWYSNNVDADFSHSAETVGWFTYRVGNADLNILVNNWYSSPNPDCLSY